MGDNRDHLILGDIEIWLPKGDKRAVETAKELLDLYESSFEES